MAASAPAAMRSPSCSDEDEDEDKDRKGPTCHAGLLAFAAERAALEAKPWHVPDERLRELVERQLLQRQDEDCGAVASTAAKLAGSFNSSGALRRSSATLASPSTGIGEVIRKTVPPSCGCRAMLSVGRVQAPGFDRSQYARAPDGSGSSKAGPATEFASQEPQSPPSSKDLRAMNPNYPECQFSPTDGWVSSPKFSASASNLRDERERRSLSVPGRIASVAASSGKASHTIEIFVYLHEHSDRLSLMVPSSMRLGPDAPPPSTSLQQEFLQWTPAWTSSLKGLIEQVTGIEVCRQQLFHGSSRMANDRRRLRHCGIDDGTTINVRITKEERPKKPDREVHLSSALLRKEKEEVRHKLEQSAAAAVRSGPRVLRPGAPGSGVRVMPKWQPSSPLKCFGTAVGGMGPLDWYGDAKETTRMFGDYGTWHPCNEDTESGFSRLRSSAPYVNPVNYAPAVV